MLDDDQYEQIMLLLPKDIGVSFKEAVREKARVIELKKGETLFTENSKNTNVYYILKGSC